MIITHKLDMDFISKHENAALPQIRMVQGDCNTRVIQLSLYADRVAWNIPEGAAVQMRYRKPDGTGGIYDTMPDGTQAWSIAGNIVSVQIVPQMLTVAGMVRTQIALVLNEKFLATFEVLVAVEEDPSIGTLESDDYKNLQTWMTEKIHSVLSAAMGSGIFDGATFVPAVSPSGELSWSNNRDLPNPAPVNLNAPQGILPVANGGTGSDNAVGARANLGAASLEYAKKIGNPHNLLDNSDFTNPVNQRGVESFTGGSSINNGDISLDKWLFYGTDTAFNVTADGLTAVNGGAATCGVAQRLRNGVMKSGVKYTLACKANVSGTVSLSWGNTATAITGSYAVENDVNKVHVFTFTPDDSSTGIYNVRIRSSNSPATLNVTWMALYEGEYTEETLPAYQPKGYNVELLNCDAFSPEMQVGVEYCTTERYKGSPVYVKMISYTPDLPLGSESGTAHWNVPHSITNFGTLVRINGTLAGKYPIPTASAAGGSLSIGQVSASGIEVMSTKWVTSAAEVFAVYYTKTA